MCIKTLSLLSQESYFCRNCKFVAICLFSEETMNAQDPGGKVCFPRPISEIRKAAEGDKAEELWTPWDERQNERERGSHHTDGKLRDQTGDPPQAVCSPGPASSCNSCGSLISAPTAASLAPHACLLLA